MAAEAGRITVLSESLENFVREVDLGGGSCVATHEEAVLWVERVAMVVLLDHKGVVIDQLARYAGEVDDVNSLKQQAMQTARWAAEAMKLEVGGDLGVEIWKILRVEPMVRRGQAVVPAPPGLCLEGEFVDSAWSSEESTKVPNGVLVWSSRDDPAAVP